MLKVSYICERFGPKLVPLSTLKLAVAFQALMAPVECRNFADMQYF